MIRGQLRSLAWRDISGYFWCIHDVTLSLLESDSEVTDELVLVNGNGGVVTRDGETNKVRGFA